MIKRVVILQETFPRYRVEFFSQICRRSAERDIDVQVVHGRAPGTRGERTGGGTLPNASVIRNRYVPIPGVKTEAVWQPALRKCLQADLVVVEQASRLLINYVLLFAERARGPKVAFWGHGRNLQAPPTRMAERLKSRLATCPSWWFAYTPAVATGLVARGVEASRITVVGNTIDVVGLRREVEQCRAGTKTVSPAKCVYMGGLYPLKCLELLFRAADLIAERLPGFELHIAGAGEQRGDAERFAERRPWAHYWGPVEGEVRAGLLASSQLLLIPGLVGLVLLDSFAAGVPLVTTADATHSPEIEYLEDGVNGVIVPVGMGARGYASAVVQLLTDSDRREALSSGARNSARFHTLESAAERFVVGIAAALETPSADR
jgi:glycosyltransferase involved in cell wall biosynthesis